MQATLCQLTAITISNELKKVAKDSIFEVYLCGGGVHNLQLIQFLQQALPNCHIESTQALGLAPDWVEAVAFAWLAKRHLHRQTGNLPAVTGALKEVVLGGQYPA